LHGIDLDSIVKNRPTGGFFMRALKCVWLAREGVRFMLKPYLFIYIFPWFDWGVILPQVVNLAEEFGGLFGIVQG